MKRLIRAALTKLGNRAPRCDKARIQPPRFGAAYLHIEQCRLTSGHRGDHQPGLPEPVGTFPRMPRTDMLVSTGPRRIGEWAVCEDCGYSPYTEEAQL